MDVLDGEAQLRSKKELIERFISDHFPDMPASADVGTEFHDYWEAEKQKALAKLAEEENLKSEGLSKVIGDYLFTERTPMRDDVIAILNERPSLKQRGTIAERVTAKIKAFVETFLDGVD